MNRVISDDDLYHFGPFCLDEGERVLLRDGRLVPLAPKALSTLIVLVRNMGHVVEKNILMNEVWPDEDVEEGNLAQHIFMLRKALGENPKYIETVPRRGYRFLATTNRIHRTSKRNTENAEAYEAYFKARTCWNIHTAEGLRQALGYFQQATNEDPNYSFAYAGLVDCYLRLATNYFPPPNVLSKSSATTHPREVGATFPETNTSVEIRCQWDRENAKREWQRADELKLDYPAVHQWRAAYLFSLGLYNQTLMKTEQLVDSASNAPSSSPSNLQARFEPVSLTPAEELQVFCVVAREQIEAGNYDAACMVLERWWTMGEWPKLDGLNSRLSADLLLTVGTLAGFVASARQVPRGQKHAEALLNGAIGLSEQLGSKMLSCEGRVDLALCYQRQGMLDLARATFLAALQVLPTSEFEIRRFALISLASVEWEAGRLNDSAARLKEADEIVEPASPLINARSYLHLAVTLQTLATSETRGEYLQRALEYCSKAVEQYEAIGNHRYAAIAENNYGYLLVTFNRLDEAEPHLVRARELFAALDDKRRCAEVDDSIAHLHLAAGRLELAEEAVRQAVNALESGGLDGFLAESLTTQGLVLCKLGRRREAKRILDRARQIAERCGDLECSCLALLMVIEELGEHLDEEERLELSAQLEQFLTYSQKASTIERIRNALDSLQASPMSVPNQ
ncbi:MAG TPA: winged helix-turn-helix domain-containing protein [Pyrinomonadaceae bacterium]|nr:winged helix-turn-helix domain-containing protein [Pyrinomonadaceae bacterium]